MADLIPRETLVKHHNYNLELLERENHRIAKETGFSPGTILIEDLENLTMSHLYTKIKGLILEVSGSDEQRYPESIRKVYIVNPPGIFNLVWGIIRPIMEERTAAKFSFGEPKNFAKEWDTIIGKENLPKYLGGTLDWDPPKGGEVDRFFPQDLVTAKLGTGRTDGILVIETDVKKGQTFHWQVMCDKELQMGLFVKTGATTKDRKVVDGWQMKSYNEDLSPWHGWHTVKEDQILLVVLDNSANYVNRTVKYFTYIK